MSSNDDHHDFRQNHLEPLKWLFGQAYRNSERERENAVTELVEHMTADRDGLEIFDDGLGILLVAAALGALFLITTFL